MMVPIAIVLLLLLECHASQWIDPHDMNTNAKQKYMTSTTQKSTSEISLLNRECSNDCDIYHSHLKRVVSVLVNSAHIDKTDSSIYHGHIRFNIEPNDLDFLISFGKEVLTLDKLRRMDTILSQSFKRSFINEYLDEIESIQLKIYSLVVNIQNLWLLGAVCLLYVVYQLFKNNFSFAYIIKYLIIIVLICDFGIRYRFLLEDAEEHNQSVTYSAQCDPSKMTWSEWTKFWLSNKDCEKRTVTPLDAFLYQVKNIIIVPMRAIGTGMGGFGRNLFTSLPWGLNLIMWPIMLLFVIIMVIFTMVIVSGHSIEFNIFHLIKLKFGGTRSHQENVLSGSTVEKLVNQCLHRPMIQNINVSVPVGEKEKQTCCDSTSFAEIQCNSTNGACTNEIPPITDDKARLSKTKNKTNEMDKRQLKDNQESSEVNICFNSDNKCETNEGEQAIQDISQENKQPDVEET